MAKPLVIERNRITHFAMALRPEAGSHGSAPLVTLSDLEAADLHEQYLQALATLPSQPDLEPLRAMIVGDEKILRAILEAIEDLKIAEAFDGETKQVALTYTLSPTL